jgi:hypothetical protein
MMREVVVSLWDLRRPMRDAASAAGPLSGVLTAGANTV